MGVQNVTHFRSERGLEEAGASEKGVFPEVKGVPSQLEFKKVGFFRVEKGLEAFMFGLTFAVSEAKRVSKHLQ